jgi:Flp pilus assembly protein TadG
MTKTISPGSRRRREGQVLPLFALMLIALFGFAALAIDVTGAYASQRAYREAADASALAGAQDLQTATRAITSVNQSNARRHAYQILRDRLGAGAPAADATCVGNTSQSFDLDFRDCALSGTGFRFAILTPSRTCITCDPKRSVQVTVRNPQFNLSFSAVFGIRNWNVGSTSVAGLTFSAKYALVTLRPSDLLRNGNDQNLKDINLSGTNTRVNITHGDIGTNTYLVTNASSMLTLADGYFIDHVDAITPDGWNKDLAGNPVGRQIPPIIKDPAYPIPTARPANPGPMTYASQSAGLRGLLPLATCVGAPTGGSALPVGTECYKPGVYQSLFIVGGGAAPGAYLEPGVYYFDQGVSIGSGKSLWGGLQTGQRGVAIVVPQDAPGSYPGFDGTGAQFLILNRGDASCNLNTCRSLPALDVNGNEVKTSEGLTLTIMVTRDNNCFSGTTPVLCSDNQNKALKLAGNGTLIVAGVIYAPSDKVNFNANFTAQDGVVGQLIAWTVDYAGGATLNQDFPGDDGPGILRLDAACTVPTTICNY